MGGGKPPKGMKFWISDNASSDIYIGLQVYPIMVVLGTAVGLVFYFGGRKLTHPDVNFRPSMRESLFKDKMQEESEVYFESSDKSKKIVDGLSNANPLIFAKFKQRPDESDQEKMKGGVWTS